MQAAYNRPEAQPLAVQLARERFRQQAMANLLASMDTNSAAVSHDSGGELWLHLTQNAYDRLEEESALGLSADELIAGVQADLRRACHLLIERDRQNQGPVLKINSASWFLLAKPASPAWVVVAIRPQAMDFQGSLTGLPWQMIGPNASGDAGAVPLPLWLLAQAQLRDRELRLEVHSLRSPDRPADERADAVRLRRMREELPEAMEDLCSAFRLLQWERQQRVRVSWPVSIVPLNENTQANNRCSYVIEKGKSDKWPERSLRVAIGPELHARWVVVAPDPDSPSRWLLHGPSALPHELNLFELPEDQYRQQVNIANRLANPSKIYSEDTALAATQIKLPMAETLVPDFDPLPGEAVWEPRQREALQLALAGYPVCAIKGPPGTGKSTVIVGLVRRAIHAGERVLLVAPTHVALDEVLGRVHDLREKNLERMIVPARVAPADETKIKPELWEYIARNLGQNLARKSQCSIRTQLAALPFANTLEELIRRCTEIVIQLRSLIGCRQAVEQAEQRLTEAHGTLQVATKTTLERQTALRTAQATRRAARERESQIAEAARLFAEIETRFLNTQRTLTAAEQHHAGQLAALSTARTNMEHAEQKQKQAESALANARIREQDSRPEGISNRLLEFLFSTHTRAVEAVRVAVAQLNSAQSEREAAGRAVSPAEANCAAAAHALEQARNTAAGVRREARERLAPAEAAIIASLAGEPVDWFSALPDSLRRAVAMTAKIVHSSEHAHARAEIDLTQAEETERSAIEAHQVAKVATDSTRTRLAALERGMRTADLEPPEDPLHRIAEIETESAATARELERITRRRELLQRWLQFYEHEDADEQITAWALNSVNLVAATTQGIASSPEFREHEFDLVICDESSRVTRGEIIVPADRARRIVLVGDEKQLPPYVESDDEQLMHALAVIHLAEGKLETLPEMAGRLCEEWNIDEPEFRPVRVDAVCERARSILTGGELPPWPERAVEGLAIEQRLRAWRRIADALTGSCFDHVLGLLPPELTVRLSVQRRMVPDIAALVSEPVYGGDYQSPEVSPVTPLLTGAFRHAWVFLNTRSYWVARAEFGEKNQGTGFVNEGEARAVVLSLKQHVTAARHTGQPVNGLMVITFYLAQARYIESLVRKDKELRRERIAILPIDRCQGQEADVVVVSFVRTLRSPRPNAGRWLQDARRLNVSFTRARRSLVLIGNLQTLIALRGDAEGERILAHLGKCVNEHPDHQIEQLQGL